MRLSGLFLLFSLFPLALISQAINTQVEDTTTGKIILIGKCDLYGLKHNPAFSEHFKEYYGGYCPDEAILTELSSKLEDVDIQIVLGTWCHDSKVQVPHFLRILRLVNYDENMIDFVAIDRNKKAGDIKIKKLKIKKVPTFLFYKNGKELGRIIETPEVNLEADMLEILK